MTAIFWRRDSGTGRQLALQLSILLHFYCPTSSRQLTESELTPTSAVKVFAHAVSSSLESVPPFWRPPSISTHLDHLHRPPCQEGVPTSASRTSNKQIKEHSRNTLNMATMIHTSMAIMPDLCPRPGQTSPRPPLTSHPTTLILAGDQHLLQAAHMDTLFLTCLPTCGSLAPSSLLQQLKRVTLEHTWMA